MPDVTARARRLRAARFPEARAAAVARNPVEGSFWQADHIVPVSEGGGECDLSNMRTLCDVCHAAETAALRARLAQRSLAEAARGTKDIRSWLVRK